MTGSWWSCNRATGTTTSCPYPGRVSVVLLDHETRSRVALWEFTQAETEMALQQAGAGRGIEADDAVAGNASRARAACTCLCGIGCLTAERCSKIVKSRLPPPANSRRDGRLVRRPRPEAPTGRVNVAENHEAATDNSKDGRDGASPEADLGSPWRLG